MNAGNGVAAEQDVRAAFDAWDEVGCTDFDFVYDGIVDDVTAGFENNDSDTNAVIWVSSDWPSNLDGALAVTTTSFSPSTGIVVDVDIELNGERFAFTRVGETRCNPASNVQDLRNTLTHEVGHLIGLDHPPESFAFRETTMFATAPACETKKRTLEQDDIDGICFIYPTAAPTQRCEGTLVPPPSDSGDDGGGCTHVRADRGWSALTSVWLVVVAVGLLRWRRR